MRNFTDHVTYGHARDLVVRMCLAGQGRWSKLDAALTEGGYFTRPDGSNTGWTIYPLIKQMLEEGEIERVSRGQYVARCPRCGEPVLNVAGTEH